MDNMENVFLRLGYALKELKSYHNSTIILGAGCSLSSTTRDISTPGIMRACLAEHGIENTLDYSWEELYKTFINVVWQGKGKIERKLLLQKKLGDVKPSDGHYFLRSLVENGYIHNIITTNFDMLLETSFEGISYKKRVGIGEYETIGNTPIANIIKVHGDLEKGEFRFAPDELMKLPQNLRDDIDLKTSGLLIVVGYRGQDIGLMNSLNVSDEFATYWIDVNKPNSCDAYMTKHIFDFMARRNSLSNFLSGNQFGDFHKIMKNLNALLICPTYNNVIKSKEIVLNDEWKKSSILALLSIYDRIYELFLDILQTAYKVAKQLNKHINNIQFTKSYNEHLYSYLYFFNSEKLPSDLLHIPNNEVDALILGTSIEVIVRTLSCNIAPQEFINDLRTEFKKIHTEAIINDSFWKAITNIVTSNVESNNNIQIDINHQLVLNSYNVPLEELCEIIRAIQFLSSLLPATYIDNKNCNKHCQVQGLLKGKYESLKVSKRKVIVNFGVIEQKCVGPLIDFYTTTFSDAHKDFEENTIEKTCICFSSKWVDINFEIEPSTVNLDNDFLSIYRIIEKRAQETSKLFLNLGDTFNKIKHIQHINLAFDNDLMDFMNSKYSSLFVIGTSGSGKTTALQNLVKNLTKNTLSIIISPKNTLVNRFGISIFLDIDINIVDEKIILQQINAALNERMKKLILIFDGLNELNGNIEKQKLYYISLLKLAEQIQLNECQNIKLIITCRERAYYQYKSLSELQLNFMYFYNKQKGSLVESTDASYHIAPLKKSEKYMLLEKYIGENIKSLSQNRKDSLYKTLEKVDTPFMVAAISETLNQEKYMNIINSHYLLYNSFANTMLSRLKDAEVYIAQKIIYAYFDLMIEFRNSDIEITKFKLLDKLPVQYHEKFEVVFNSLIDINIFLDDKSRNQRVKFQHDKIEEFFFKEYIREYEYKGIDFFNKIFDLSYKNVIYQGGLLQYISNLIIDKKLKLLKELSINLFDIHIKVLPQMIVEALSFSSNLNDVLGYLINIGDVEDSSKMLNIIIWGMDDSLQDYSIIKFDLKNIIKELNILSKTNFIINNQKAYISFLESKIYYFENDYTEAQNLIEQALKQANNGNRILLSKIRIQKAVILMELGFSKESIKLLEKEYDLFKDSNDLKSIFDIGIELGRALNHSGQIEHTLNLYNSLIDIEPTISNPYSLARLYEQKANTLNRIMYDKLQYGFNRGENISKFVREEVDDLFKEANQLYSKSMDLLLKINAIWSYSGVVPEKINTYLSYSMSIYPIGITECKHMIEEVDNIFADLSTPFKADFYLAKAYYFEYTKDFEQAEIFIFKALDNAISMRIKNKEAKCHEFYGQFIYRCLLNNINIHTNSNMIEEGLNHINQAINYYKTYTVTENNIALKNNIMLKSWLENWEK